MLEDPVSDLLRNRNNPEWIEHVQKTHKDAMDALQELIEIISRRDLAGSSLHTCAYGV